ncbi:MAG: PaaI family thioesterase [Armatimonadetes bacterium]|nr:PaaI family thioesterase [Armatimonadota bacterium]
MSATDRPELGVDDYCFACGRANPKGLHLTFRFEGEEYVCDFTAAREYQGWTDILHGGIVSTVMDEVMTRMLWERRISAMTAELTVRLKRPTPVGQPLTARAWLVSQRRRLYETEAELALADGTVTATATGKFLQVDPPGE